MEDLTPVQHDEPELVARARAGTLSEPEIEEVVRLLTTQPDHEDAYTRLNALGWTKRHDLVTVVAPFLERPEDPMLSGLALQVLVGRWGLGREFADAVIRFSNGVDWDEDDDVRLVALSSAGELARVDIRRSEFVTVLLRTVRDVTQRPLVREAAYSAILRALAVDWRDLPGAGRHEDLDAQIDSSVIAQAEQMTRVADDG